MMHLLAATFGLFSVVSCYTPTHMRAAVMSSRSWDFKFHLEKVAVVDLPVPTPGHGEVLVKVEASNLNPVDSKIVEMAGLFWSYPRVLGTDVTGVVVAVGSGCQRLKIGDEVWGEATSGNPLNYGRTYAEYAAVPESVLGLRPKSLSVFEAGAMPMVALTGYEALTWAAGGERFKGDDVTVLVLGGSGGTGHLGIQLAKAMGAKRVITTCSSSNADFVRSVGADEVIDYHTQNYYDVLAPQSVDVVYDCVGLPGTGDHAFDLLKKHGHFATLLPSGKASWSKRLRRRDVYQSAPMCTGSCSNFDRIDAIAAMVGQGKLRVHIDKHFGLEDVKSAFQASIGGHTVGKVVLQVSKNLSAVVAEQAVVI
eukprot:TRINITY_DN662_c0_g1_i4.p1 TRINITY_DN662_c0_g1~~TRINITY_DN662_c0_g1_i4.p1  ORF type:complete len:366 (-),score=63.05 TRINITY_DN662_c0_g1_i4:131-1228(-)